MDGLVIGIDINSAYTTVCCQEQEKFWTVPTTVSEGDSQDDWNQFLEKTLKQVTDELGTEEILKLAVTAFEVNAAFNERILAFADFFAIEREQVHLISHTESFLYYVLSQKKELWSNQTALFALTGQTLCYYEMKMQRGLAKNMVQATCEVLEKSFDRGLLETPAGRMKCDEMLTKRGGQLLEHKLFSSIFLTGKGFQVQDWARNFMKLLCYRRKVFADPELFARGAAKKAEDCTKKSSEYPYIFLCEGRLSVEVSMIARRAGKLGELVLASYGDNWYEADSCTELILENEDAVTLTVTGLDQKQRKEITIPLIDFPKRPRRTTRIELKIAFSNAHTMAVTIRDKGFGELFPATHAEVYREVEL